MPLDPIGSLARALQLEEALRSQREGRRIEGAIGTRGQGLLEQFQENYGDLTRVPMPQRQGYTSYTGVPWDVASQGFQSKARQTRLNQALATLANVATSSEDQRRKTEEMFSYMAPNLPPETRKLLEMHMQSSDQYVSGLFDNVSMMYPELATDPQFMGAVQRYKANLMLRKPGRATPAPSPGGQVVTPGVQPGPVQAQPNYLADIFGGRSD